MIKVKVEYMNGKISIYDVEYPKAYIAKIIESENDLLEDQKSVMAIYAADKLIAKFKNGFLNELVLEYAYKKKLTAGMGKYKGHTVPAGCDVGHHSVNLDGSGSIYGISDEDLKDKIKADEDWNEYQANLKAVDKSNWVTDHTGGDIEIIYC